MRLGLGIGIGDWGLGIGIGDWRLGLALGLELGKKIGIGDTDWD